jgi:hypothetical protein
MISDLNCITFAGGGLSPIHRELAGVMHCGQDVLTNGFGGWIRPVSDRETAEVSFAEYRYQNNQAPQMEIPLLRAQPVYDQTENHVIDSSGLWDKKGQFQWNQLEAIRDGPASLWINSDSTSAGTYDRISQAEATTVMS